MHSPDIDVVVGTLLCSRDVACCWTPWGLRLRQVLTSPSNALMGTYIHGPMGVRLGDNVANVMGSNVHQHKTEGIFTEHCVVIVEGKMTAGVFEVNMHICQT